MNRTIRTAAATTALLLGALGAFGTTPAYAADPAPVDVTTKLQADPAALAPGRTLILHSTTEVVTGTVSKLATTISLPRGVTYVRPEPGSYEYKECAPAADGRSLTCSSLAAPHQRVWASPTFKIDEDVAPGTELTFKATTDIGDAVDATPENNTASAKATAATGTDLGVSWKKPAGSVHAGQGVSAELVVTNHGPGTAKAAVVSFYAGWENLPSIDDKRCWWDPGTAICESYVPLAPGESVSFKLTWNFPKSAVGTTYRASAGLTFRDPLDPATANDTAELVFKVLKPTGPTPTPKPTPKPTPTPSKPQPTPTPSASVSTSSSPAPAPAAQSGGGGDELANTGSAPLTALAGTAAALAAAGVLLAARTRGRRR